jgi:hypothetical protein
LEIQRRDEGLQIAMISQDSRRRDKVAYSSPKDFLLYVRARSNKISSHQMQGLRRVERGTEVVEASSIRFDRVGDPTVSSMGTSFLECFQGL